MGYFLEFWLKATENRLRERKELPILVFLICQATCKEN